MFSTNHYELVISNCKKLEQMLEDGLGASGRGLHEKVSSVQDSLPAPFVRMLGEVHEKINEISNKVDRGLERQRIAQEEMKCIRQTWTTFNETYGEYLKSELRKAGDREDLRKALIKHGTMVAITALLIFIANAIWKEVIIQFH
jgi:hypothetical protein